MAFVAGQRLTAALLNSEIDTAVNTAAWTSYTPVWTTTGTAPAIGNGTLVGAYRQVGKTVNIRVYWVAGSTTTFGTGSWLFSLPVAPKSGIEQVICANGNDASASQAAGGAAIVTNTGGIFRTYIGAASAGFTSTVPWTWANGDSARWTGTYEAA